jgi:fermentation-respiration switch protein FrsA (DUF1100 family)
VILVLLALENALIFHPIRDTEDWEPPPNDRVRDVEFQTGDGVSLHAWWCPTDGWEPSQGALLYCHGNAGNLSHRGPLIADWQRHTGQAVLIFDYPGYGRSSGSPSEAGCYAAGEAAYDWLTQTMNVPGDRILLYGKSLGGSIATELATHRPHRALILTSAFTSIPDMAQALYPFLPARWLVRTRFDNLAKVGSCPRPVFLAHGSADRLIPCSQGERLYAAANEPKRFLCMQGFDHNRAPGTEFYAALRAFLAEVEAGVAPTSPAAR